MKKVSIHIVLSCFLVLPSFAQDDVFLKVKKHYEATGETLKAKAVDFIDENIDIHSSCCYVWKDSTGKAFDFNELEYNNFNESRAALKQLIETYRLRPVRMEVKDREQMTEGILKDIIERGFESWNKPWNKNLSFDDFCDYLLPYRVQNEPFENWQENFSVRFSALAKDKASDICNSANNQLKQWFFSSFAFEDRMGLRYMLSPSQMLFRKQGMCEDLCALSVYVMRTLGLACSVDFTPAWATSSYAHYWCTFIDETNVHRPFEGVTGTAADFVVYREPSKVFRISYRSRPDALAAQIPSEQIPPGHLRLANIIDVTKNYWRTAQLNSKLKKLPANGITYIAVFNALNWYPVDWTKPQEEGDYTFNDLSVGVIYLPVNYENEQYIVAGYPVLIHADKKTTELVPDYNNKITINITEAPKYLKYRTGKKYSFYYWDDHWISAGTKVASDSKSLAFEEIPSNTVYLLVPEYSEGKERIFTVNKTGEIERW